MFSFLLNLVGAYFLFCVFSASAVAVAAAAVAASADAFRIRRGAGFVNADVVLSIFFDANVFAAACAAFSDTEAGAFATAAFSDSSVSASASASAAVAFPIRRGASNFDVSDSLFFCGGFLFFFW